MIQTNLRVLKGTRRPPERGDVFFMQVPNGVYLFGRVALASVPRPRAPMPGSNLIYIYEWQSRVPQPEYSKLLPNKLLMPPVWTNNLPWTKGHFQHIENRPLGDFDLLRQHCFHVAPLDPGSRSTYVDESGRKLERRIEPCGEWGLASYRWIDDHVSDAVEVPRVPDTSED
jgi:hypothetical protein